jgi:hypothetical protein
MWNLPGQPDLKTKKEMGDTIKLGLRERPTCYDCCRYMGLYVI